MSSTTTVFYTSSTSRIVCSIKLSQRVGSDPSVVIFSPDSVVSEQLYSIKSLNTCHNIFVHNVQNGSYVDYINSISLCMLKAGIPCDTIVAASEGTSFMVYSPSGNSVVSLYLDGSATLDALHDKCKLEYARMLSLLGVDEDH